MYARADRVFKQDFKVSGSLQGGLVKQLGSEPKELRVNDAFYLQNFKGIRNLGYHFDEASEKKGLGGDILGFDKHLTALVKVSRDEPHDISALNYFEAQPFLFAQASLAPNRSIKAN